jgi:hypothetical protein
MITNTDCYIAFDLHYSISTTALSDCMLWTMSSGLLHTFNYILTCSRLESSRRFGSSQASAQSVSEENWKFQQHGNEVSDSYRDFWKVT